MRCNAGRLLLPVFPTLAILFLLAGCDGFSGGVEERAAIPPASAEASPDAEDDFGLGPGVRPLSSGPGDKGSPRVSPTGEKVAFVLDGRAAEKPLYTEDLRLRTAGNLEAEGVEWLPDGELAILGEGGEGASPGPLFVARSEEAADSESGPDVRKIAGSSGAAGSAPGSRSVIAAVPAPPDLDPSVETSADRLLVLLREQEGLVQIRLGYIEGHVTGLSVAPDGHGAALAVETAPEGAGGSRFEVQTIPFSGEASRRVARVPEGKEVLGAPQWTQKGVYFVAGEAPAGASPGRGDRGRDGEEPGSYALYRAEEDSEAPFEPVRGVGEDFVASSISVSPDGNRLAVVGRRNPGSPTELYILDLASDTLKAATANENMEIKTNPHDLAWSPDGFSVVIVARGAPSDPEAYDAGGQPPPSAFYNLYEVPVGDPNDNPKGD